MPGAAHARGSGRRSTGWNGRDERRPVLQALFGLEGRVALVSGARQGIGEAIAEGLARAGAAVALTSRDRAALGRSPTALGRSAPGARARARAVAAPTQVEECVADTVAAFGRLDILVDNAGLSVHADAFDLELEDWDRVFATNLRGAFLLARSAAAVMMERGGGASSTLLAVRARRPAAPRGVLGGKAASSSSTSRWRWSGPPRHHGGRGRAHDRVTESRPSLFRDEGAGGAGSPDPLGRLGLAADVVGVLMLCGAARCS